MGEIAGHRPQVSLVTGGGGFLGGAIVRRLLARGDTVRSLSRKRYHWHTDVGVDGRVGDIADPTAVQAACEGVDVVFHTAALPGVWGKRSDFERVNLGGTETVIDACRAAGVKRLIHTSSPSVVFDGMDMAGVDESVHYPVRHLAHYPKTKAAAERRVREAAAEGLPAIILRPHLIWGPRDNHLVPRILARSGKLVRVGDGRNLVDTTYIDNAASAHINADEALAANPDLSGRIYFISQGEPIPLWEMVDEILRAGGKPPVRGTIPRRLAWLIGAVLEGVYGIFRLPGEPRMTRFMAEELATAHWFDISAARRDLGYAPTISTRDGLDALTRWLAARPA